MDAGLVFLVEGLAEVVVVDGDGGGDPGDEGEGCPGGAFYFLNSGFVRIAIRHWFGFLLVCRACLRVARLLVRGFGCARFVV